MEQGVREGWREGREGREGGRGREGGEGGEGGREREGGREIEGRKEGEEEGDAGMMNTRVHRKKTST